MDTLLELCSRHNALGDKAIAYFDEATALSKQLDNQLAIARVLILRAQFSDVQGQQSKAIELLNQAMKLLAKAEESEEAKPILHLA